MHLFLWSYIVVVFFILVSLPSESMVAVAATVAVTVTVAVAATVAVTICRINLESLQSWSLWQYELTSSSPFWSSHTHIHTILTYTYNTPQLNIFLAILVDAYSKVKSEAADAGMCMYLVHAHTCMHMHLHEACAKVTDAGRRMQGLVHACMHACVYIYIYIYYILKHSYIYLCVYMWCIC
jgi:hypothetical protein